MVKATSLEVVIAIVDCVELEEEIPEDKENGSDEYDKEFESSLVRGRPLVEILTNVTHHLPKGLQIIQGAEDHDYERTCNEEVENKRRGHHDEPRGVHGVVFRESAKTRGFEWCCIWGICEDSRV